MGEKEKVMDEKALDAFVDDNRLEDEAVAEDELDAAEEVADDEEEETAEDEETGETPSDEKGEVETWTKKAVISERRKRQAAEREIAAMREKVSYLEGAASMLEDDDGPDDDDDDFDYADLGASTRKVISKQLEASQRAQQAAKDREWQEIVSDCMEDAKDKYDDAEDVIDYYVKMEKADPSLARRVRRQADPVEWAYARAKAKMEEDGEHGDLRKENEELRARLGELEQDGPEPVRKKRLAGKRGTGTRATRSEPLTAESVLKDVFKGR